MTKPIEETIGTAAGHVEESAAPVSMWGNAVKIGQPLANIIARYSHAAAPLPQIEFDEVSNVEGVGKIRGALEVKGADLILVLPGYHEQIHSRDSIRIVLADGTTVDTQGSASVYTGSGMFEFPDGERIEGYITKFRLKRWHWSSEPRPVAWVGLLRGAPIKEFSCNLAVRNHRWQGVTSIRLQGNAAWHFLRTSDEESCLVIVDNQGIGDSQPLYEDFMALEFLFGTPLRLEGLVGVNATNEPVAAFGTDFGYRFQAGLGANPPVPFSRMNFADASSSTEERLDICWMAAAMPKLVKAIAANDLTPTSAAIAAYVSSMNGFVDEQYLMAQIGLEGLASRISTPDDERKLVKDFAAWEKWVVSVKGDLKHHAIDQVTLQILVNKLKSSGRPTTSTLVKRVMSRLGVNAPEKGLDEIRGRSGVAHDLSMTRNKEYDQTVFERIRIVRCLLAALLLRHVGFTGMILGWEMNAEGWATPADWVVPSAEAQREAETLYEACASAL
jgi:hypothetical protein